MRMSEAGVALLARLEGCVLTAYQDPKGIWTIGIGDTGPSVVKGLHITQEEAYQRCQTRLTNEYEPAVNKIQIPMSQAEFDALVIFCYNVGVTGFLSSQTYAKMCLGDRTAASEGFMHWTDHGLLTIRRQHERDLFDHGEY